jgi:hypothetical protein
VSLADPATAYRVGPTRPGRASQGRGRAPAERQRIQAGFGHADQTVTIELGDTTLRVIDQHGELITAVPRNGTSEISRFKAYGTRRSS